MTALIEFEIIAILMLAALSCAVLGAIIVIRGGSSCTIDAAAKSSVLGFAAGFLLYQWITPAAIIPIGVASALFGIWASDKITAVAEKNAASAAISFVLLALGVLIITGFTDICGADISTLTVGDWYFAPFDRIRANGYDFGPLAFYIFGAVFIFNITCALIFHKEIRLSALDEGYARSVQLKIDTLNSLLSFMTALTVAAVFRITGVFMAAAFILAPALTARFYAKSQFALIVTSVLISGTACLTGFGIAYKMDVPATALAVCVLGAFFLISAFLAPEKGLIPALRERRKKRLRDCMLIVSGHLYSREQLTVPDLSATLAWSKNFTGKIIFAMKRDGLVEEKNGFLTLTQKGREMLKFLNPSVPSGHLPLPVEA